MTRRCRYCGAVVEDHQPDDAPCTVCFAHVPGGAIVGVTFSALILLVAVLGVGFVLAAFWFAP